MRVLELRSRKRGGELLHVGLMFAQQGRPDAGLAASGRDLLADSPPDDAPWLGPDPWPRSMEVAPHWPVNRSRLRICPSPPWWCRRSPLARPRKIRCAPRSELSAEDRAGHDPRAWLRALQIAWQPKVAPVEDWAQLISAYIGDLDERMPQAQPIYAGSAGRSLPRSA